MSTEQITVGDLLRALEGISPETWVCLDNGPATQVIKELSANEPFIVIR